MISQPVASDDCSVSCQQHGADHGNKSVHCQYRLQASLSFMTVRPLHSLNGYIVTCSHPTNIPLSQFARL